jgi:hypothetical protein
MGGVRGKGMRKLSGAWRDGQEFGGLFVLWRGARLRRVCSVVLPRSGERLSIYLSVCDAVPRSQVSVSPAGGRSDANDVYTCRRALLYCVRATA